MGLFDRFRRTPVAPPIDGIAFDTRGMTDQGVRDGQRVWTTTSGDMLSASCTPRSSPLVRTSADRMRESIVAGTADHPVKLVEFSAIMIDGCPVFRIIRKGPQQPHGLTYAGTLSFAYRDFVAVLAVTCPEHGMTGMREAVLPDRLLGTGEVTITQPPRIDGNWQPDSEQYDAEFPQHPLSRLRPLLAHVERTCRLSPEWRAQRTAEIS